MPRTNIAVLDGVQTLIFQQGAPDGLVTLAKKVFPSGMKISIKIEIPKTAKKAGLAMCFQELDALRVPRKVRSNITGVSQSYISKLLSESRMG